MFIDIFDTSPIKGSVKDFDPVEIFMVSGTEDEIIWDELVNKYHYLGHEQIIGRRIKYLVLWQDRPVAALSFHSAILKIECRDQFIGWTFEQRQKNLHRIVDNNRFLILPWVQIKYLASHLLSRVLKQLPHDWYRLYGSEPLLVETYVDLSKYEGTCYRAANWIYVGQTKGFRVEGQKYIYHGNKKGVYLYPLKKNFRDILGIKPAQPLEPRALLGLSRREEKMLLAEINWDPEIIERIGLNLETIKALNSKLLQFHETFTDCFNHVGQRKHGLIYIKGLMSDVERKCLEQIALDFSGEKEVRLLQHFHQKGKWDDEAMLLEYQKQTAEIIAVGEGMHTVDGSDTPKKGKESVGVARQHCGKLGKVENCQAGVFVGYTSPAGYALLNRQLYIPKIWFTDEYQKRREKCEVPEDLEFLTKPEIATNLIQQVEETGLFPAKWLGCDTAFGSNHDFIDSIKDDYWYFADQKANTKVWLTWPEVGIPTYSGRGRYPTKEKALEEPIELEEIARTAAEHEWTTVVLGEGSKGPIIGKVLCRRVVTQRDDLPYEEVWLYIRKYSNGKLRYSFSNAPEDIPRSELDKAALMRWPIEQSFENAKDQLGMDEYELRSWKGWHRHMLYVFLAMLFLLMIQYEFTDESPVLTLPQARRLIKAAMSNNDSDIFKCIKKVEYYMKRTYEAYVSYCKKKFAILQTMKC